MNTPSDKKKELRLKHTCIELRRIQNRVASNLRNIRLNRGLNTEEMGKILGLSGACYRYRESGSNFPKQVEFDIINKEFGIDETLLLYKESEISITWET